MQREQRGPRRRRSNRPQSGKGLRLFIAIYPPRGMIEQILQTGRLFLHEHAADFAEGTAQFVPVDQVHLTVHFLGNVSPRRLDDTLESLDRAKKGLHALRHYELLRL